MTINVRNSLILKKIRFCILYNVAVLQGKYIKFIFENTILCEKVN